MSWELHRPGHQLARVVGSAVNPRQAVKAAGTSLPYVLPVTLRNEEPIGYTIASAGASGLAAQERVTVYEETNYVKAVLGASCGVFAEVTVGSSNGALVPQSVASAAGDWSHGRTEVAGVAGDVITLYVRPRKVA